ncbi:MAG: Hsp20/alpha crystallin family protein [Candidatus Hadarchaeales archaeon]
MFEGDFFERIKKMVEEMERKTEVQVDIRESNASQVKVRRRVTTFPEGEIKGTLETEYMCVEKPREVIFCMRIPGVGKEGVEIRRRGKAIEIVARRRDGNAYFSTFELPKNAVPEERVLRIKGGLLVLIIPKRKRI